MILFYVLALWQTSCQKILEYRFGETLGKYVFDSSLNNRHGFVSAVNANWTNRGIYLTGDDDKIAPKSFTFIIPATVFMWVLPIEYTGSMFSLKNFENKRMILSFFNGKLIMYRQDGRRTNYRIHNSKLNEHKWILVRAFLKPRTYASNYTPYIEKSLSDNNYRATNQIVSMNIGAIGRRFPAIAAFIWYFVIITGEIENSIYYSTQNSCDANLECNRCSYYIIDPIYEKICLSNSTDVNSSSSISVCSSNFCGNYTFVNNCTCTGFCLYYFTNNSNSCQNYTNYCDLPLVDVGADCCLSMCSSCSDADSCTMCLDSSAEPVDPIIKGKDPCECSDGYWGTPSSSLTNLTCKKCPLSCSKCTNEILCTECSDSNAIIINSLCKCKEGYSAQENITHFECIPCSSTCKSCNSSQCLECYTNLSTPVGQSCVCTDGYYLEKTSSNYECLLCPSSCTKCSSLTNCSKCFDPLAKLSNGKCSCPNLFIGSGTLSNPCVPVCGRACTACSTQNTCTNCYDTNANIIDGKCTCMIGFYLNNSDKRSCLQCGRGCYKCDESGMCEECFDTNSASEYADCECLEGYYGEYLEVSNNLTCFRCNSDCMICTSFDNCTSCVDENAYSNEGICECKEKSFNSSVTNMCEPCHSDCKSCNTSTECLICISKYADPDEFQGCKCREGFYNDSALSSENSCKKCHNLCQKCESLNKCLKCKGGNTKIVDGICQCAPGYYFKEKSSVDCDACITFKEAESCKKDCGKGKAWHNLTCVNCPQNCLDCDDSLNCLECVEGMKSENGKCVCLKAQKLENNKCVTQYFKLTISVGLNNSILLDFDENLESNLKTSSLKLYVSGNSEDIILTKKNEKEYIVDLKETQIFTISSAFSLEISSPLYSSNNSMLKNYEYYGDLSPSPKTQFAKAMKSTMKGVMTSTFASAMVSNPASCWILINTIQIIIYLPLSPINYSTKILEFLQALAGYSILPNLMEYMFDAETSSKPIQRFQRVGLSTTVFWINIGQNFVMLIFNLSIWPFLILGSKFPYISGPCFKLLQNYKYSLFLRFWIEVYLELGLFSLIQIQSV